MTQVQRIHEYFIHQQESIAIAMGVDQHSLQERTLKTMEELGELASAIKMHNTSDIREEAVDVWLCAVSVMFAHRPRLVLDIAFERWFFETMEQCLNDQIADKSQDISADIAMGKLAQTVLCLTGTCGSRYKKLDRMALVKAAEQIATYALDVYFITDGDLKGFLNICDTKVTKWINKARAEK